MSTRVAPAYLATLARPSEQTKNAAASYVEGTRRSTTARRDRNRGAGRQLGQGGAETVFGQRVRVDPGGEPRQIALGVVELGRQPAQRDRTLAVALGRERRQPIGDPRRGAARTPVVQLIAEAPALIVAGLDEPAARRIDLAQPRRHLRLHARVGDGQARGGRHGRRELAVRERGRIVEQRGDRIAVLVHERDALPGRVSPRQLDRPADLIDPSVAAGDAVGDLQPGIAERARQSGAQRLGLVAIAEVDHQAGDGRACPAPPQQIRRQADRGDRHRDVVGPQRGGVRVGAGEPGDRGERRASRRWPTSPASATARARRSAPPAAR